MYAVIVQIKDAWHVTKHYADTRRLTAVYKRLRKKYPGIIPMKTVYVSEDGAYYDMYDNAIDVVGKL